MESLDEHLNQAQVKVEVNAQQEVIGLLLQEDENEGEHEESESSDVAHMSVAMTASALIEQQHEAGQDDQQVLHISPDETDHTDMQQQMSMVVDPADLAQSLQHGSVQAVTLEDGTTAIIQQAFGKDGNMLSEGHIQLEDGTTAILQNVIQAESKTASDLGMSQFVEGQAIQLEDGTMAYIQHSKNKGPDGLQAVTLEDGTMAYIAHATPEQLFAEGSQLTATNDITLEQLTQVGHSNDESDIKEESLGMSPSKSSERALALGDKAFKCLFEGCGRLYTTHHHLKVHERAHTGDRPFRCHFVTCDKAFATAYGLKSHTRVHTGEKPYKCPEENCDKGFKTSGDLQKHVRTHTGERPFKCPFEGCDRAFTTSNIRKVHIRTHTGERPYICNEDGCNKAFASATNYKNHIRIHSGEKPYVCTVQGCNKRFTEYSSLYKHHVVHTHTKPYVCSHCGKNYRQTSTLAMHKRTAHGDDSACEGDTLLMEEADDDMDSSDGPPMKQPRLHLQIAAPGMVPAATGNGEEEEGALVINTTAEQVAMVTSDSQQISDEQTMAAAISQQAAQAAISQLQQTQGITLSDGDQQIYVVTDPAQLEALQQLAQQHQLGDIQQAVDSDGKTISFSLQENGECSIIPMSTASNLVTFQTE